MSPWMSIGAESTMVWASIPMCTVYLPEGIFHSSSRTSQCDTASAASMTKQDGPQGDDLHLSSLRRTVLLSPGGTSYTLSKACKVYCGTFNPVGVSGGGSTHTKTA